MECTGKRCVELENKCHSGFCPRRRGRRVQKDGRCLQTLTQDGIGRWLGSSPRLFHFDFSRATDPMHNQSPFRAIVQSWLAHARQISPAHCHCHCHCTPHRPTPPPPVYIPYPYPRAKRNPFTSHGSPFDLFSLQLVFHALQPYAPLLQLTPHTAFSFQRTNNPPVR